MTITGPSVTSGTDASLSFACPALVTCSFQCALDGETPVDCTSPALVALPNEGDYVFQVSASATDGRTGSADHAITVDRTSPSIVDVEFTEYDEITLTFGEPIGAADLADFSITEKPLGMAVHSVEVAGAEVRVRLTRLHLPWNGYRLSFTVDDAAGDPLAVVDRDLTPDLHSRLAFATETEVTGAITLPGGVACGAATGLGRADCLCQHEATQAGMVGTFRAAMSATGPGRLLSHAWARRDRSGQLRARGRHRSAGPRAVGARRRPRGFRELRQHDRHLLRAPRDAPRREHPDREPVDGDYGQPQRQRLELRRMDRRRHRHARLPSDATSPVRVERARVDVRQLRRAPLRPGRRERKPIVDVPATARRVFVSSVEVDGLSTHTSGASGLAAADAICTELAAGAGLPGTSYVAMLSDNDDDAFCRLLGLTGERGVNDCGATPGQLGDGPFVSVHGHLLADDVAELLTIDNSPATGGPREPYMANESGEFQYLATSWTGMNNVGVASTTTCADWASNTTGGSYLGKPYASGYEFVSAGSNVCSSDAHLVCVER